MPASNARVATRRTLPLNVTFLALAAVLATGTLARSAEAQGANGAPDREAVIELRARFLNDLDTLQAKFMALAEVIPAEKYGWRPAPEVRSIGEAFRHVTVEYYLWTPRAWGRTPSPMAPTSRDAALKFEKASSKAEVLKDLAAGFVFMRESVVAADVDALTGTRPLFGGENTVVETTLIMSGDLHEHLGQLIAYARMNGIAPPWSK
jgi:hypothetical protein